MNKKLLVLFLLSTLLIQGCSLDIFKEENEISKIYDELENKLGEDREKYILNHFKQNNLQKYKNKYIIKDTCNIIGKIKGDSSDLAIVLTSNSNNLSGMSLLLDNVKTINNFYDNNKKNADVIFIAFNEKYNNTSENKQIINDITSNYNGLININLDNLNLDVDQKIIISGKEGVSNKLAKEIEVSLNDHSINNNIKYNDDVVISNFTDNNVAAITLHDNKENKDKNSVDFTYLDSISSSIMNFITTKGSNSYYMETTLSEEEYQKSKEEKDKLKFGEYKILEVGKSKEFIYNNTLMTSNINELNSLFPNIDIQKEIEDFSFNEIKLEINNPKIDHRELETNKVYKQEFNSRDINSLNIRYLNGKEVLIFRLNDKVENIPSNKVLVKSTTKIEDKNWTINYEKDLEYIHSFQTKLNKDKEYLVEVMIGERVKNNDINYNYTFQHINELKNIIKKIEIERVINSINN